jgi:16S rRNA (cytosine1407-C5)-methyltransferase
VCKAWEIPLVEGLLTAQGFRFEPEPFSPLARRLVYEPVPLGSSLAATFGYIYIQDRSSMLPPLALDPQRAASVLDMCASPGSKTGLLGQLVGMEGFVLGNEPSRNRLATLRRNLGSLNLFNCATTSNPGESLPLPGGLWPYILLDPPCSGWGTVEKNPRVLDLWQGDKVKPLIALQRRLLAEAWRLLRPGGLLAYSTCTTNVEENEEQVRYARDDLGFEFLPLPPLPGFSFTDPALPGFSGVLRVEAGEDGQGFFVALLQKPHDAPLADAVPGNACPSAGKSRDDTQESPQAADAPRLPENYGPAQFRGKRKGPQGKTGKNRFTAPAVEFLSRGALFAPHAPQTDKALQAEGASARNILWADPDLLPPGDLAVFNDVVHFLPAASRDLLPQGFAWKGFPLGRLSSGGLRLNPALHGLMPGLEQAEKQGLACLNLEETTPLLSLLQGQSLEVGAGSSEANLYFQGLPLCRLSIKGRRAIIPPL